MSKYTIRWTEAASTSYLEELENILKRWTVKEALTFEALKNDLLERLKLHSELCPEIKRLKVRRCVLSYQTSLVYRVNGSSIELLAFVANRTNHNYID